MRDGRMGRCSDLATRAAATFIVTATVVLRFGDSHANAPLVESGLGDIITGAIQEVLRLLFSPIRGVIEEHGDAVLQTVVGTPHPDAVFSAPANDAWPAIYEYYWQTFFPLSLTLFGLVIGLVIFLESTSHLFSSYHRSKLKKRAFAGLLGLLSWWWIAALSLRFMDTLARFLVPAVSDITVFQTLSFSGMGVLGTVVALTANFVLFILIGLIYLARHLALYLFVLLMPLLIVFWIPGVGPFRLASAFMKKLAGFYVPFLFMTVPVALLFRLGDLLGTSVGPSAGEFGAWLTALVIPLLAVLSPFILFWQAGALFFMADRASKYMSAQRAQRRVAGGRDRLQTGRRGGRNLARGLRNEPAVTGSGQYVLDSGESRAHATGRRLRSASSRIRGTLLPVSERTDGEDGGRRDAPASRVEPGNVDGRDGFGDEAGRTNRDPLRDPRSDQSSDSSDIEDAEDRS
ncbi:hypothetical protein [Salinirussus salinus]|uniref:hypothetical protein n=1 Tax=Salinirussus salinus TaxID=1198300 RepID=UPI001F16D1E5|nr:hypothetical protein [Salinirussus salinus]